MLRLPSYSPGRTLCIVMPHGVLCMARQMCALHRAFMLNVHGAQTHQLRLVRVRLNGTQQPLHALPRGYGALPECRPVRYAIALVCSTPNIKLRIIALPGLSLQVNYSTQPHRRGRVWLQCQVPIMLGRSSHASLHLTAMPPLDLCTHVVTCAVGGGGLWLW